MTRTNWQNEIKYYLNLYNAELEGVSGVGLDFKTLYIRTQKGYVFTVGGNNYKEAFLRLRKEDLTR